MKVHGILAAALIAIAPAGAALGQSDTGSGQGASCFAPGKDSDDVREQRALKTAPRGARRTSAHTLVVTIRSGPRRFADKKPYRDELSGFHWHYCGYARGLQAHLIGMDDESLFSGKLLFDRSGLLMDAGNWVDPSPDGKWFIAGSQEDGSELEEWKVSDLSGKALWTGYAGVVVNDIVLQEFRDSHWTPDGVLHAVAVCGDKAGTQGEASFVHDGGVWHWRSDARCGG